MGGVFIILELYEVGLNLKYYDKNKTHWFYQVEAHISHMKKPSSVGKAAWEVALFFKNSLGTTGFPPAAPLNPGMLLFTE